MNLLLEAGRIHVVTVDLAPHVPVILRVVAAHVPEAGRHVRARDGGNVQDVRVGVRKYPAGQALELGRRISSISRRES